MAEFYVHDGEFLLACGVAPDGMEQLQAKPGQFVELGTPPGYNPAAFAAPGHRWHVRQRRFVDVRSDAQRRAHAIEQVQAARRQAYPAIGDQLDMLWHAMDAGVLPKIEPMYSDIKAVKAANKKPAVK